MRAKEQGKLSRAPLREVFGSKQNLHKLFVVFGGVTAGMTVVWYTSHLYVLFFLTQSLRVDPMTAILLLGTGLLLGSPFFILNGHLSGRIGRMPVIMTGMLAAALLLIPLFKGLTHFANPQLAAAAKANPVVVAANPTTCGFQFDPLGRRTNTTDCDKAKALLSKMGVPYTSAKLSAGSAIQITVGGTPDLMLKQSRTQCEQRLTRQAPIPRG